VKRSLALVLALVLGVLALAVYHRTVFSSGFEQFPGNEGDPRLSVYLTEHWYQVFRGQDTPFAPGMFYPIRGANLWGDNMLLHALPYSLLRAAGWDMFSALTVPILLFNLFNYLTCLYLLHRVCRFSLTASIPAALFFAFNSLQFNHVQHFNLQQVFLLPLIVSCIVVLFRERERLTQLEAFGLLSLAALLLNLQILSAGYHAWFFSMWSLLFLLLALIVPASRRIVLATSRRFWPALGGSLIVFAICLGPIVVMYRSVTAAVGVRQYAELNELTPEGWSLLQMGVDNYVWGRFSAWLDRIHPIFSTELNIGIGLIPSLALIGLIGWSLWTVARKGRLRRAELTPPQSSSLFLALMMLAASLFYIVGMRYANGWSPWLYVFRFVPGASSLRGVARYPMVLALPMAIGFAAATQLALDTIARRPAPFARVILTSGLLLILAFGVVEQFGRTSSFSKTAQLERLNRIAARLPENCDVFYAAPSPDRRPIKYEYQLDAMLISMMRHIPTLNGYNAYAPRGWRLTEVEAPDYEERVASWIKRTHVSGRICRLEIGD
jgi:hypothetical protein